MKFSVPSILVALLLAIFTYKNGYTLQNIADVLFWIWIFFFGVTLVLMVIADQTGKKMPVIHSTSLLSIHLLAWAFCKFIIWLE